MTNTQPWIITAETLKQELAESKSGKRPEPILLVDVREPEEFEEGHIEGCMLIPVGEIAERAAAELPQEADIVLYCAAGVRSLSALMALRKLGYPRLRSLEGGIHAWDELA